MTDQGVNIDETVDTIAQSLLERAKSRDEEAWGRLVYLYSPLVYQWCRDAGVEPNSAADVGQEVFAAVARKIGDFRRDAEGSTFRGWLRTITQNKLKDHWRAAEKKPQVVGTAVIDRVAVPQGQSGSTTSVDDADADSNVLFHRIVEFIRNQFSDQDWQAFWRVTVDHLPAAQVAEELGCTRNKVYLAKSRILGRIRDEFGQERAEKCGDKQTNK